MHQLPIHVARRQGELNDQTSYKSIRMVNLPADRSLTSRSWALSGERERTTPPKLHFLEPKVPKEVSLVLRVRVSYATSLAETLQDR